MADFVGANDPEFASIYANSSAPAPGTPGGTTPPAGGTPASGNAPGPIGDQIPSDRVAQNPNPALDPQEPGGAFATSSPQGQALSNPNNPYLDTSISGGIAYTPAQARQAWNQWFQNPVNLLTAPPELIAGSLVLSPDEIARARSMQASGTLPPAPPGYNPLNLPVGEGIGQGQFGGYGSAANALQASAALSSFGNGSQAQTDYLNALRSLGIQTPMYTGPGVGYNEVTAYNQMIQNGGNPVVPQYINGQRVLVHPDGTPFADQAQAESLLAGYGQGNYAVNQANQARIQQLNDAAAKDRQYAANLAKSDPTRAQVYAQRAAQYEQEAQSLNLPVGSDAMQAQAPQPTSGTTAPAASPAPSSTPATGAVTQAPAQQPSQPAQPSQPTEDVARLRAAVAQDQRYISNLQAVHNPTPQQQQELANYQQRVTDYNTRIQAAGG